MLILIIYYLNNVQVLNNFNTKYNIKSLTLYRGIQKYAAKNQTCNNLLYKIFQHIKLYVPGIRGVLGLAFRT